MTHRSVIFSGCCSEWSPSSLCRGSFLGNVTAQLTETTLTDRPQRQRTVENPTQQLTEYVNAFKNFTLAGSLHGFVTVPLTLWCERRGADAETPQLECADAECLCILFMYCKCFDKALNREMCEMLN